MSTEVASNVIIDNSISGFIHNLDAELIHATATFDLSIRGGQKEPIILSPVDRI